VIIYTNADRDDHLQGILDLQRRNLPGNLDEAEARSQGFVTVRHSLGDLQQMNVIERHAIAVDGKSVVAYLLAMTPASRNNVPVLIPMFEMIDTIVYEDRPIAAYGYIVVGQACVDKLYRGKGVFDAIYHHYVQYFRERYRLIITEIDATNTRSLRAHIRFGFRTVKEYTAPNGVSWHIVLLDPKKLPEQIN
jgi:GNAT superfamily N-acetyltransferase